VRFGSKLLVQRRGRLSPTSLRARTVTSQGRTERPGV